MDSPLRPLHSGATLSQSKLDQFAKMENQDLIESLKPGQPGSLKVSPDGLMIDGHHRVQILRDRGIDVNALPREIVAKDQPPGEEL
jgi:hypothetical protein